MSLKETLDLKPDYNPPKLWSVEDLPARGGVVKRLNAPLTIETKFNPVRAKATDIAKVQAVKFGDMLKAGYKPSEAARKLHTTVKEIMSREQTQVMLKELIEKFTFDAKVRALAQRALVNKGMLENSTPEGDQKLLLEYLKLAAADKETGINDPAQINISTGATIDPALKKTLDLISLPEIEAAPEENETPLENHKT